MKQVERTAEILAFKVLNRDIDKIWFEWAVEMLMNNFESENLLFLAGENENTNQFELQKIAEKALKELKLDYSNEENVIKDYICYLIDQALTGNRSYKSVLQILKDLYYEVENTSVLRDFYLLYYAYEDLEFDTVQHYWPEGDRENIDKIITNHFIKIKNQCV